MNLSIGEHGCGALQTLLCVVDHTRRRNDQRHTRELHERDACTDAIGG